VIEGEERERKRRKGGEGTFGPLRDFLGMPLEKLPYSSTCNYIIHEINET
jgi:hypothetical protein